MTFSEVSCLLQVIITCLHGKEYQTVPGKKMKGSPGSLRTLEQYYPSTDKKKTEWKCAYWGQNCDRVQKINFLDGTGI